MLRLAQFDRPRPSDTHAQQTSGRSMRAYQLPQATGIEALAKVDLPMPKPAHRQVLVKVAACSLNFRDLAIVLGRYRMAVKPNVIPLSDGAGEVVEVGPGVTRVKAGDRVAGRFFPTLARRPARQRTPRAARSAAASTACWREYVVLEEEGVVKLPAHLSLEEGACLPCAGVTAWNALAEHGQADRRRQRSGARHRRRFDLCAAVRPADGRDRDRDLVERRKARARQEARRVARHQLQDDAGLGQGRGRTYRRTRRRSGDRSRRRRHHRKIAGRDPLRAARYR